MGRGIGGLIGLGIGLAILGNVMKKTDVKKKMNKKRKKSSMSDFVMRETQI